MRRRAFILALALVLPVLVAACGGDDEESAEPPPAPAATETEAAAETTEEAGALELAADPGGELAFDTTTLEAAAGEITIHFTNESSVPHNVTIEDVEGGATETITASSADLTVSLEPGEYTFFCSVGGHRGAGMEGTLTVS